MKKVSVICVDCEDDYIDRVLIDQTYQNLEVVKTITGEEFYQDITEYCESTDSEYICFLEPNQKIDSQKIQKMVEYAEKIENADIIFCNRNYIECDGTVVAHADKAYNGVFKEKVFDGTEVLRVCMQEGNNLLGNITTTMFRKNKVKISLNNLEQYKIEGNQRLQRAFLLFELLIGHTMILEEEELVSTYVKEFNLEELKKEQAIFCEQMQTFCKIHNIEQEANLLFGISKEHRELLQSIPAKKKNVKKEITFFCQDKGEYYNLLPIMKEADKRGYKVSYTDDLNVKAEIGVYCQHFGRPENSKFSVVLLHDMAQGHNRWPNLWELERWNEYDIGIVPGVNWKNRWERCAFQYYTNPRCGAYMLGYPKSNEIFSKELEDRVKELRKSMNMKYDISVLYAPSWENDEKEDDFIRALASLPINLLIKQASWPKEYMHIIKNIQDMRKLHEGKYDNLYYIEPEESIMVALKMCDLIVSDESSVMIEGLMFGKISIAVKDWLIPDTVPSRFASIPFENVHKCKKVELREQVEKIIAENMGNEEIQKASEDFFVNKGNVNKDILDAIEYFAMGKEKNDFMKWKMSECYMPANMWS